MTEPGSWEETKVIRLVAPNRRNVWRASFATSDHIRTKRNLNRLGYSLIHLTNNVDFLVQGMKKNLAQVEVKLSITELFEGDSYADTYVALRCGKTSAAKTSAGQMSLILCDVALCQRDRHHPRVVLRLEVQGLLCILQF